MNDRPVSTQARRFNDPTFPTLPYLGFETPTNVSYGTSAALDKLGALFAILMALGPLAMAAYGAKFGAG